MTVFYATTRPTSGPPYTTSVDVAYCSSEEALRGVVDRRPFDLR
jgi:hypothetical protein